jgi:quercetin dioxygenase-like cupin family protein
MKPLIRLVPAVFAALLALVPAHASSPAVAEPSAATVPGAAAYTSAVKVTPLLKTKVDAAGRPIAYPTDGAAEITAILVEVPPGGRTGWHKHPLPCLGYILEGELHVTLIDGRVNIFRAGQALAETVDLEHEGVNPGPGAAKLVMFVLGTEGKAFTVKTPAPASVPATP